MTDDARTPPHDILAEQSALGGMMLSRDAAHEVSEILQGADFYRPAHQLIFEAATALLSRGEPVDALSVNAELTKRGETTRVGGAPYLHTLTEAIPTAANAGYYARMVADRAVLRRMVEVGTHIAQLGYAGDGEIADLVDTAQAEMMAVGERAAPRAFSTVGDGLAARMDEIERRGRTRGLSGLPTGLADLDELTQGWQGGQLVVVAARPSIGKSTLALDFARAAAHAGHTTAFFSLEMSRGELIDRMLSAEAKVPLHSIKDGSLSDADWDAVARVTPKIADAPLYPEDAPSATLGDVRSACRRLKREKDLKLVVVDYLQLMRTGGRHDTRENEVSEISRGLKLLAKELDIAVIALSQLNRKAEDRADKRPQVSDMRESGAVEQDADVVVLIHRPDVYDKETTRAGEADLIVGKNRNGATGEVTVAFQGHYSRFVDMAPEPAAPRP